ncbi:hypothetical protein TorRG33x02_183620, partial [Trema orientale]
MKTLGRVSFLWPRICCSSPRKPESIDKSRSSIETRNPLRIDRTALQSSNVDRTTRRLVKYTTMRFSAPGRQITGSGARFGSSGCCSGSGRAGGGGRVDQARRRELARRTRWKTTKVFLGWWRRWWLWWWLAGWSEEQRFSMSLKEEQEKRDEGDDDDDDDDDDVSWIRVGDLPHGRHI